MIGGVVVSQIKTGDELHSPLSFRGEADIVFSLERNEARRAVVTASEDGGPLIYYTHHGSPSRYGWGLPKR